MRVLLEACVDSVTAASHAEAAGAGRLELCAAIDVGGVTPPLDTLALVRAQTTVPLHVLIRPRPGDFHYDAAEAGTMLREITEARRLGADGVVLGGLTAEGRIDAALTRRLLDAARPLRVTFHRAIDHSRDPLEALDALLALGIERVLSAGGAASADQGMATLSRLVQRAGNAAVIMAGGGIREHNVERIVTGTGVREVHLRYGEWFPAVAAKLSRAD